MVLTDDARVWHGGRFETSIVWSIFPKDSGGSRRTS